MLKERTGQPIGSYSVTRWWSKWEIMNQMLVGFGDIEPFLSLADFSEGMRMKLL